MEFQSCICKWMELTFSLVVEHWTSELSIVDSSHVLDKNIESCIRKWAELHGFVVLHVIDHFTLLSVNVHLHVQFCIRLSDVTLCTTEEVVAIYSHMRGPEPVQERSMLNHLSLSFCTKRNRNSVRFRCWCWTSPLAERARSWLAVTGIVTSWKQTTINESIY